MVNEKDLAALRENLAAGGVFTKVTDVRVPKLLLHVVDASVQMDQTTTNLNTKILNLTRVGIFLGIVGGYRQRIEAASFQEARRRSEGRKG